MNEPTVSVIIPTHNRRVLLEQTLRSLCAQTFDDWQALVIDDASSDGTAAFVRSQAEKEPRISLHERVGERGGAQVCRNMGTTLARGKYLVFLDSDDLLSPQCLGERVAAMERTPDADFLVFRSQMFNEQPGDLLFLWNVDNGEDDLDRFLRLDIPWCITSPVWRRGSLARVGPWDEDRPSWQDWDLHVRALILGLRYERVPIVDAYIRTRDTTSRATISRAIASSEHLMAARDLLDKTHKALLDAQKCNSRRRLLMAGLYWSLVERLLKQNDLPNAKIVWRSAQRAGVIGRTQYWQGLTYLSLVNGPASLRRMWRLMLYRLWPAEIFSAGSATHKKAPFPDNTLSSASSSVPTTSAFSQQAH